LPPKGGTIITIDATYLIDVAERKSASLGGNRGPREKRLKKSMPKRKKRIAREWESFAAEFGGMVTVTRG